MLKNRIIYIISPEPWGVNFVSKHHYASLLSETNEVYFFNPPSSKTFVEEKKKGLKVVSYSLPKGLNRLPRIVRFFAHSFFAKRMMKQLALPSPDVVWSFDPYVFQNLSAFNTKAIKIYHPVDVHYTDLEFDSVYSSDVVFSTAHLILDKFKHVYKPKYFINHGLADHFIQPPSASGEFDFVSQHQALKVGYVGNLRYQHLDYTTLFHIIEAHSQCYFYFVGPFEASNLNVTNSQFESEIQRLKSYENVFLLGEKPSEQIPEFFSKMDLFLMCYKGKEKPSEMANPHKILEYLSTGKPVVTHFIDEYKKMKECVTMVDSNDDLVKTFGYVIGKLEDYSSWQLQVKRREVALANSYLKQLELIENYLEKIHS